MTMTDSVPYALDNDEVTASAMLDNLAAVWDDFTRERLTQAGIRKGARCWEAAAGNGSIAHWLADQGAQVIATDVNPKHIRPHDGVTVLQHDDEQDPAPGQGFDLIHARCAFAHWPTRDAVVAKFAAALAPGGALVIEDWGKWLGWVLSSPVPDAAGIYDRYQTALLRVFESAGNDTGWAGRTADAMSAAGLVRVDTAVQSGTWRGGSAHCRLPIVVSTELRQPLLAHGATEEDLDALPEVLQHEETLLLGNIGFSTIGYRPA